MFRARGMQSFSERRCISYCMPNGDRQFCIDQEYGRHSYRIRPRVVWEQRIMRCVIVFCSAQRNICYCYWLSALMECLVLMTVNCEQDSRWKKNDEHLSLVEREMALRFANCSKTNTSVPMLMAMWMRNKYCHFYL